MRAGLAAIFCLTLVACAERPYPSESGVIVYQGAGRIRADETVIWDDWGMRSVTVRNSTRRENGRRVPHQTRTIMTPNTTYSYASSTQGYLRVNAGTRRVFGPHRSASDLEDAGTDTVAGVECQSQRDARRGSEICMAGRLVLRVVTRNGGKIATQVNLNAEVDPAIFEPDGQMAMELSAEQLRRMMFLGG